MRKAAAMALSEEQIRQLTDDIVRSLQAIPQVASSASQPASQPSDGGCAAVGAGQWLCDSMQEAVAQAKAAQLALAAMTLEKRGEIIQAMRDAAIRHAEPLARLAHEETGYGRVEDKVQKNLLAARRTPGVEDLQSVARTGDEGMTLTEQAPFGVIGSITPSTNPTATVVNNAISMIAAGNAVVFNPHPAAKRCSQQAMCILNEAVVQAGGPAGLLCGVREPSLETGQALMRHADIALLSITGGEAVVQAAMKSGKKVIAAGPGNPPVIVDETADIKRAARDIVAGASFDNNVMCIAEKEVFVVAGVADALMQEMQKHGAVRIGGQDIQRVLALTLKQQDGRYVINRAYVGKSAGQIARDAGLAAGGEARLLIAEVDAGHPFVMTEMLMPVLAIVRVANVDAAIEAAYVAEQGCKHSAMIHSSNVHHMSRAVKRMNTTLFVKNAPSYAGLGFGGEGCTTMTIATPTGEGVTTARSFTRARRCVLYGDFRIC